MKVNYSYAVQSFFSRVDMHKCKCNDTAAAFA